MTTRILAIVATLIGVWTSTAEASIVVTLDFTGVITASTDFMGDTSFGVGTPFSGHVTYDVANAESISFQESNPGNFSGFASSSSGIIQYVNGVPVNDRGTGTPVVIDYQFNWVGGVVTPWEYSLDFSDASRRVNLFDVPPAFFTGEGWSTLRHQVRIDTEGDIANRNLTNTITRRTLTRIIHVARVKKKEPSRDLLRL